MIVLDNNRDLMRELYSIVSLDLLVSKSLERVFGSSGRLVSLVVSSPVLLVASLFFTVMVSMDLLWLQMARTVLF